MGESKNLTPEEAGFDGAKGVAFPYHGEQCRFLLRRGKKPPLNYPNNNFKEQLVWYYPDNQPSRLLWCNAENQWFELKFSPLDRESVFPITEENLIA